MKKLFVETYGWPLFRVCDAFWRCGHGFSGAGAGVAGGVYRRMKGPGALLFLLGFLQVIAIQPAVQAESIEGFEVQGGPAFVERTREALALLRRTSHFELIQQRIKIIREAERSGMRAYDALPTCEVGPATWKQSAAWYAGAIAHDAYHSQLYCEAKRQNQDREPDADVWTGTEAERQCLTYQEEVLQEMGADAALIRYVRQTREHPTYQGDSRSWEDYRKRQW